MKNDFVNSKATKISWDVLKTVFFPRLQRDSNDKGTVFL